MVAAVFLPQFKLLLCGRTPGWMGAVHKVRHAILDQF